jgi:predicted ATPase
MEMAPSHVLIENGKQGSLIPVLIEERALLRSISVSGFKSLENFNLEFHKGLNVLIGPNGSGKTNILNFIEFLGHLSRHQLLEAVSRSGGAGRIFRRDNTGALGKSVNFILRGDGRYHDYNDEKVLHVFYEYGAEITLSGRSGSLAYSRQFLKLAYEPPDQSGWPVEINVSATDVDKIAVVISDGIERHFEDQYLPRRAKINPSEIKTALRELITRNASTSALFRLLTRYVQASEFLTQDLYGAQSFNISPTSVRRAEDIASDPTIEEDGRGLAAVLFALTRSRRETYYEDYYGPRRFFREPEETLTKVLAYSKIVNDAILDITVEPDAIENQLRIFLKVDYGDGSLALPFSLVSDGTAKWFTLVTAIVTSSAVFSIEEPENFLHPQMQKEIVSIVRDTFLTGNREGFAVMTTHSETILNCVDPDEMVLVHMESGRTVAKRPTNSEDIRREIHQTGFGAGYYYLAGAIE